jgi:carbon-monoxide dehydrogenase medium subunit
VKAPDFSYLRVSSLGDALDALARHGEEAMVLAGGQSLMAMHNLRVAQAGVLVDINPVPGLDAIRDVGDHVVLGCLARYAALESSDLVRDYLPLMARALPHVAHSAIRNRGTIGGSLALADPAAELPACCLALGATLVIASRDGEREVAVEDFFTGLYETALGPGELLVEVRIPKSEGAAATHFAELSRRPGDFALAGIAFTARARAGTIHDPRLAVFGVADRPVLARATMQLLADERPGQVDRQALGAALDHDAPAFDDLAHPAAYRRQVVRVLVQRMLDGMDPALA